jgi:acetylornithine deacetylase/succinyl-diaminopimelate desuccinylase family protein
MSTLSDDATLLSAVESSEADLISLLRSLVSFRTESQSSQCMHFPEEAARAMSFLAEWLSAIDFEVDTWDVGPSATFERHPVLVAEHRGDGYGRSVAFNAHVDVVPAAPAQAWSHPPFAGTVDSEGRMWGRGTSDMKGGLAAALIGVRCVLDNLGHAGYGGVAFHIVTDEEVVGSGTREIIARHGSPDAVVSMEPTSMALCASEPGLVHFRMEVEGEASHASNRYLSVYAGGRAGGGVNAIEKAMLLASALERLERQWGNSKSHASFPPGYNTMTPGVIVGGAGGGSDGKLNLAVNPGTCPDYCALEYNVWYYPSEELGGIRREIEEYIADVCRTDPWLRSHPPRFEWKLRNIYFPPFDLATDNAAVVAMADTLQSLGLASEATVFRGGSDLAWYRPSVGGFVFGPGRIEYAHAVDEYVRTQDLVAAAKAYAVFAKLWCTRMR